MYKNQYIITSQETTSKYPDFTSFQFDRFHIHAHASLNVSIVNRGMKEIALIGNIINPEKPGETNGQVIEKLTDGCSTINEFLKRIQVFSGRYVLFFKNPVSFIVAGDACHLRHIYFSELNGDMVITSSPRLFLEFFELELEVTPEKKEFVGRSIYKARESSWYGNSSIDNRLNKLLPNHYLDINSKKVARIPILFTNEILNENEIMDYAIFVLKGTFSSLAQNYKLIQPLSAGWDTRILLAACKDVRELIQFYVFDRTSGQADDAWVPDNLSKKLRLNFKMINPERLKENFLENYRKEHIIPRILPKTEHIQYHYECRYGPDVVNVNGNGAEITRCVYGTKKKNISLDMLLVMSGYQKKVPFVNEEIEKWYLPANRYAEEHGISLLDLFYWEQRMGNWGALYPFEQDIAVEEMSPFNNRSLLASLLRVPPERRKSPGFPFFRKLIQNLWDEVLSEPINPDRSYIKSVIRGNSTMKYLALKFQSFIRA